MSSEEIPEVTGPASENAEERRILWRCRRGTRELDIFLIPYAEKVFPELNRRGREIFTELLALEDTVLTEWLVHRQSPDSRFVSLVEHIFRFHSEGASQWNQE